MVIKTHLITPFHWLESAHLGEETNHLWHQFLLIFVRCNCSSNIFQIASKNFYSGTLFTGMHWLRNAYLCEQTNHPWHSNHWWVTRTKLHFLLWHLHCIALHCMFEETKHLWHSNHWLVTGTNWRNNAVLAKVIVISTSVFLLLKICFIWFCIIDWIIGTSLGTVLQFSWGTSEHSLRGNFWHFCLKCFPH